MSYGRYGYGGWAPYVPAAQKKANGAKSAAALAKKQGRAPSPVQIEGRKIATTFWGLSWCDNLEAYSDFANRLPRGATYVRNGSVVDLIIKPRLIEALVAGSETYTIKITIESLPKPAWNQIKQDCSASIDSLLDLLAGRFSDGVMQRLTQQKVGLFPSPNDIKMKCSCPDYSYCCKHLAAVMYGIGHRLDKQPELLFLLRDVNHQELISAAVADGNLDRELSGKRDNTLQDADLGALFGIELDAGTPTRKVATTARKPAPSKRSKVAKPTSPPVVEKKVPAPKSKTVKSPPAVVRKSIATQKGAAAKSSKAKKKSSTVMPSVASRKPATENKKPTSPTPQVAQKPAAKSSSATGSSKASAPVISHKSTAKSTSKPAAAKRSK